MHQGLIKFFDNGGRAFVVSSRGELFEQVRIDALGVVFDNEGESHGIDPIAFNTRRQFVIAVHQFFHFRVLRHGRIELQADSARNVVFDGQIAPQVG